MNLKKIKESFVSNWPEKIVCLAIAIVIFVFHRMASLETRNLTVPLNINNSNELIISSDVQKDVRIILRGNEKDITPITDNDIVAFIDLSNYNNPGKYEVPIRITKRGTALQVDPLEIDTIPPLISVDLDRRAKKIVAISPLISGKLPSGYEMERLSIVPETIEIEGPEEIINGMSAIATENIDLSNRIVSFTKNVHLTTGNPLVTIDGVTNAAFSAVVKNVQTVKDFSALPVKIKNLPEGLSAELQTTNIDLLLQGANSDIEKITDTDSILFIDCSVIETAGTYTLNVASEAIDGITIVEIKPSTISVTVRTEKKEE
ncbi:MAG: hypothetical protein Ta2B_19510 [Termitinemataceae bacterium]|nr:MAG: hypothetical protein Ta2B_19510 [Termitinemataceae bacterium]